MGTGLPTATAFFYGGLVTMTTLSPSSRILRNPCGVARTKLEARGEEKKVGMKQ